MPIHAPFASVPVSPISGPGITEVQVSGEFEVRRKCLFLSSTSDLLKTVTYSYRTYRLVDKQLSLNFLILRYVGSNN
jgi:hypothetical protein